MFDFDFNESAKSTPITTNSFLKADTIHDVTIKEITYGFTSKANIYYDTINITYEDENGATFIDRIFKPKDEVEANKPQELKFGLFPSQNSVILNKLMLNINAFYPKFYEHIRTGEQKVKLKGFSNLYKFLDKVWKSAKEDEKNEENLWFKLKLMKKKNGYSKIPNFLKINKDSKETWISNVYIGKDVVFSEYETKEIEERNNAKPSTSLDLENNSSLDLDLSNTGPEESDGLNLENKGDDLFSDLD